MTLDSRLTDILSVKEEEEKEEDREGQMMLKVSAHLEVCLLEWESSLPL